MLVNYGDGIGVGVLVDGYLPSVKTMETKARQILGGRYDELISPAAHRNRDLMFWETMPRSVTRQPSDYLDMFYFAAGIPSGERQRYARIHREGKLENNHRANRSVVFIYYNRQNDIAIDVAAALRHARLGIKRVGFRVKSEERYESAERFKREAEKLLDELVEPYVAPCLVAEEKLNGAGFRGSPLAMSPIRMQPLWRP